MPIPTQVILVPFVAFALNAQTPAIRVVQDMDFGALVADERGGRIVLTEQGALLVQGPGVGPARQSLGKEARFTLTGLPKTNFTVTLQPLTPELNGPGNPLRITAFVLGTWTLQGTFDAQGRAELRAGAQLDIPAQTQPGPYTQLRMRIELTTAEGTASQRITETFAIKALLRPVLRITNQGPLDFGNLFPGSRLGAYRAPPVGPPGAMGGDGPQQFRGTPRSAEFNVNGTPGADFSIVLPREIQLHGPGAPLVVKDFTANVPLRSQMPKEGFTFRVGATLVVPAEQTPGRYTGVFAVSLDYQ